MDDKWIEMPDRVLDVREVFHSIDALLKYYRHAKSFCAHAIDAMDWYFDDQVITSEVLAIRKSRLKTETIMAHVDTMLARYRDLCSLYGAARRYNVIARKYLDLPQDGGRKYTNRELADLFDCDERTISREIKTAKSELSVLIFGEEGKKNLKT